MQENQRERLSESERAEESQRERERERARESIVDRESHRARNVFQNKTGIGSLGRHRLDMPTVEEYEEQMVHRVSETKTSS